MYKKKLISFTANHEAVCAVCAGTGWVFEEGERFVCPECAGTGKVTF